jgi:hypothetical protein
MDDRSGWDTISKVLGREVTPVVVYSAFADDEPEGVLKDIIIRKVKKGSGENLGEILKPIIKMKSALKKEKERIQKEYGTLTLQTFSKIIGQKDLGSMDENLLANLSTTRLIYYLLNNPISAGTGNIPESIFVYPPMKNEPDNCLLSGEFLEQIINGGNKSIWLVVSPSCDLYYKTGTKGKISDVLLLRCFRKHSEMSQLVGKNESDRKSNLRTRVEVKTAKILKCPEQIFGCKYLFISFKDYITISYDEIVTGYQSGKWIKIAALSIPYAESLKNMYIADLSRIGTPDTAKLDDEREWCDDFARI